MLDRPAPGLVYSYCMQNKKAGSRGAASTPGFMERLKRHHIFRVASLYALVAWVLIQVANQVFPNIGLTRGDIRTLIIVLVLGFPVALALGWTLITPSEVDPRKLSRWRRLRWRLGGAVSLLMIVLATASGAYLWRLNPQHPDAGGAIPAKSIAVLPFENLSGDPGNAYFSGGVQDEILTRLAKVHALKVVSRTSTLKYASHPESLKSVGEELGVAAILEGSVQRVGETVRVNVQLINTADDTHLWAETYDRDTRDIFSAETDIATNVADALKATLLPDESARIASIPTQDPVAYDFYLKARFLSDDTSRGTAKDPASEVRQALDLYAQAIKQDPGFALAFVYRSRACSNAYWYGYVNDPALIEQARADAEQALKLAPDLPEAHLAMAYVHYYGARDYDRAMAELQLAQAALPNDADIISTIAFIERRRGKIEESIPDLQRASLLDPKNTLYPQELGNSAGMLGHYAQASASYTQALALSPDNYEAYAFRIIMQVFQGRLSEAEFAADGASKDADAQGRISLIRYGIARLKRDPEAMSRAIADMPPVVVRRWIHTPVPRALLSGDVAAMAGDQAAAGKAYVAAALQLQEQLKRTPEDSSVWWTLSELEASRGHQAEALKDARKSVELLPVSKDSIFGPFSLYNLAVIEARFGLTDPALTDLETVLAKPHGLIVSVPVLRLDPDWDQVRKDPRFDALLKKYASGED